MPKYTTRLRARKVRVGTSRRLPVKKGNVKLRTNAHKVLVQGTGRAVGQAFGNSRIPKQIGLPGGAWDAFNSCHAPLPRSVGPYTVVRTSRLFTSNDIINIFGTFQVHESSETPRTNGPYWSNIISAQSKTSVGPIHTGPSTSFSITNMPGGNDTNPDSSTFTCCPAAISVQIVGSESVMNAQGQLAAAVCPARLDLSDDARSWTEVENQFVAFFRPRLMSAGKLVLRGVQMDSHPLSMTDCSDFLPMKGTNADLPAQAWGGATAPHPRGWAPIVIYNPGQTTLSFIVSVEWRVRFDMSHPAVSTHTHHGVTTDAAWDKHIQRASAALPGVFDIVEKVANSGMAMYRNAQSAGLIGG
jgi:hypothetical protein